MARKMVPTALALVPTADLAVLILQVVAEILQVTEGLKDNHRQAFRLSERVKSIEPSLVAVRQGTGTLYSTESLRQLLATVRKIRTFLKEYAEMGVMLRAYRRKSNAEEFVQLGAILTEGVQAFHLDLTVNARVEQDAPDRMKPLQPEAAVDAWAEEDASDRLRDIENIREMLERMERNGAENRAEIISLSEKVQRDERSEMKGWVEIDYHNELDLEGSTVLGSGAFGEVRTAKWNGADVAVKKALGVGLPDDVIRALKKEIRVHSSLRFDFVVQLYAASTAGPDLCLVLELASGGSLQQYLHSTREPLAYSLQTAFLYDIARGMSFLHLRGILHRDLKSAKVLMFSNNRLKLCDFGLSKVKTELSSRSTVRVAGTMKWMSPEELNKKPATEQTDVYSFGVVCFEVATRTEPFPEKSEEEAARAVTLREGRPQAPDWASASPDVVPLMQQCWKQDPEERPKGFGPVVKVLMSVISRDGDPRDPRAAGADATIVSAAKSTDDAPSVGARKVPFSGRDEMEASSSRSGPGLRPAAPVAEANPHEYRGLQPSTVGGGTYVPAPEETASRRTLSQPMVLDAQRPSAWRADQSIATDGFSSRTAVKGALLRQRHLAVGHQLGDSYDLGIAKDLCKRADQLMSQCKYADADLLYDRAIAIGEKTLGPDHPDVGLWLHNRARSLANQEKHADADPLHARAIVITAKALGPDHPDLAQFLYHRAWSLVTKGKHAGAYPLYRRAIAIEEESLGRDHPDVAKGLHGLAVSLATWGKHADADPLYARAIVVRANALGPDHPDLAVLLYDRAVSLAKQGKHADANPRYCRAIALQEKVLGPDHPSVAGWLHDQAVSLAKRGKHADADLLYHQAIGIGENALGSNHPRVAPWFHSLSMSLATQGKHADADPLFARAIAIRAKALGPDHPNLAQWLRDRALSLATWGKHADADPLYGRAIAIREKALGPDHPDVAQCLQDRAVSLAKQGAWTAAIPLVERAISVRANKLGANHPASIESRSFLNFIVQQVTLSWHEGKSTCATILQSAGLGGYMEMFSEPYALDKANRYEIIRTVGRGAFGEVFLAWDTQSEQPQPPPSPSPLPYSSAETTCREIRDHDGMGVTQNRQRERGPGYVALKTVASGVSSSAGRGSPKGLSKGLFRELRALQMAAGECPHIVRLLDVYPEGSNAVLVLEYMPSDLAKVLDGAPYPLEEAHCKAYTRMLLKGLAWMHAHGLLHRDIKPSNLLLSAGGVLKIADFGQTRTHSVPQTRSYSHQVATRWYRAPELLYGTRRYGFAVDMWAAGAVVGEMLAGRPLFPGRSDIDQLHKILQVTGSPTQETWPSVKDLPDYDKVCFAEMPPQAASVVFQGSSEEACDLTQGMLRLDPLRRTSALEALQHSFFLVAPEATPCHKLLPPAPERIEPDQTRKKLGEAFLDGGWSPSGGLHGDGGREASR